MWDNREGKKNPKAPDFKCKDKDCDGVIWPPRGAKAAGNGPPRTQAAPQRANGGTSSDDRSNRIERQHSQEMAIRYAALKQLKDITPHDMVALIDWFARDVGRMPAPPQAKAAVPQPEMDEEMMPQGDADEPECEEPF
jgi:hypothetical protein